MIMKNQADVLIHDYANKYIVLVNKDMYSISLMYGI